MTTTAVFTPTPLTGRSIAPDLARGAMLLLIAVANAPWYLWTADTRDLSAHPADPAPLDLAVQSLSLIAIDGRTYPMFSFLFGYGIWQLYSRQLAAGVDRRLARRLLRRRHWWMLAFGAVHAALLWMGDIVGAYGLAGLVLTWLFLDRRDVTLRVWAVILTTLLMLVTAGGVVIDALAGALPATEQLGFELDGSISDPDYVSSIALRLLSWSVITPAQALIGLVVPITVLVAILAARSRVLEDPGAHLPALRRTAFIGIGIGWGVGIVAAAQNADLLGVSRGMDSGIAAVHGLAGMFCGVGYVAAFGLVAARLEARGIPSRTAGALQAVGKRSLTFYLAQSVVFAPLMCAWGLGLGAHLSSWSIALIAVATWLLTVALAVLLERAGRRGPAEVLLRRLAYPRSR